MPSKLPIDVNGQRLQVGSVVAYSASDSCHMFIGRVFKITNCFAWMVPIGFEDDFQWNHRREFSQVIVIGDSK